jgi:putative tryptophan/tyrosine transport system substrate-binding protein
MNKKIFGLALSALLLALSFPAEAQQLKKISRLGYLASGTPNAQSARTEAFRQGLRELGYIEGKNIAIEYRYTEGKTDRLPELAADLVSLQVDVIVASNNIAALAASSATKIIPIVIASGADPVAAGLVVSLARPGGNVTGLTNLTTDLGVKRLELLKEMLPKLTRVAVLLGPGSLGLSLKEIEVAAPSLKIQLHVMDVRAANDLERAFEGATKARAGALAVTGDPTGLFLANQKQIIELAAKKRLPAIYASSSFVNAGGLMSYAASDLENYRRAATYVDRILKGAKPAEMPVERPTKFEFAINLRAAQQIDLTIPPNLLARADRVVK